MAFAQNAPATAPANCDSTNATTAAPMASGTPAKDSAHTGDMASNGACANNPSPQMMTDNKGGGAGNSNQPGGQGNPNSNK